MSTFTTNKPWDFSHVLELVHALSPPALSESVNGDYFQKAKQPDDSTTDAERESAREEGVSLGDFTKVWHFLGTPPPEPVQTPTIQTPQSAFTSKDDYTSDGAIRYGLRNKSKKKVTWKAETSADEEVVTESASERLADKNMLLCSLTKTQRKKQRRKERKAVFDAAPTLGTVSESEADTTWSLTPARKASTHAAVSAQALKREPIRSKSSTAVAAASERQAVASSTLDGAKPSITGDGDTTTSVPRRTDIAMRQNSAPVSKTTNTLTTPCENAQWPVSTTQVSKNIRFLPATVTPRTPTPRATTSSGPSQSDTAKAVQALQVAQAALAGTPQTPTRLTTRQRVIEPKIVRSGEDRNWALLLKLIGEYDEDRKYLVSPMNMTTHNNDPAGIHIFVDASNIFIGFNDQLKRARGIPTTAKVPAVDLSFDALALLMERRRPVAKRTLVGSTPHLPAFDKAKIVGYECNILEKVYKAKELTERQIYFRDAEKRYHTRTKAAHLSSSPSNGYVSATDDCGATSGSENTITGPQFAPAKMIEQGVDEILHLKILESIVDSDAPATMVIATGDAAQAEYSDGFMAMALRALKKGWKVELVSWSKNISSMYLKRSFRDVWGSHFRVIFLDDYAEELLDM